MIGQPMVERVMVDLRRNVLILELDQPLGPEPTAEAMIDIGALGRLIGIEVGDHYLAVSDAIPGSELQGRSVTIEVTIAEDRRSVLLPRSGPTWELSFPSGNQCWNRSTAEGGSLALCSILTGG